MDAVHDVDFPIWTDFKEGIDFYDILPALANPTTMDRMVGVCADWISEHSPDYLAGIDARGFILGGAIAARLGIGFVPIRKEHKTPGPTATTSITGEYATDVLELRTDLMPQGSRVAIHDDLIATGGSLKGAVDLVRTVGCAPVAVSCIISLDQLGGTEHLGGIPFHALHRVTR